jgi:hypothetical protein
MRNNPILATFDTTPSPHRQINAPRLLLAFAHIHGEAGTPTEGICSAVVSRNERSVSMCKRGRLLPCKTTPFSLHSTPPRLRTGKSMHFVCFWPSPTSMARREHQRRASVVQWLVGTNGPFLCEKGVDYFHAKRPHSRLIRHHPVSAQANQCTSFASGLRPHPWRGGNTNGGHLERAGGW